MIPWGKNSSLHLTYVMYQGLSTCIRIKMRSNGSKTAKNTMNALKRILEYIGKKSNGSKTAKNTMNALKRILECIKKKVIETNNFHNYKHVTSPIIFS